MTLPYHGIMTTEAVPDEKRLYHLFRKCGMGEDDAFTAVQEIRTMAGHNIIAKMEAQAVAQNAKLDEISTEMKTETKTIRWMIVIVVFIATLIIAISRQ